MAAERVYPGAAPVASGRGLVASSFQYYLTGDESLRVETISNNAPFAIVDVGVRLWREDDRAIIIERERHVCSPPALSQKDYALPAGALLNLRLATSTAAAIYGRLFVRAQLIRGTGAAADVIGTLVQGYLSPQNDIAWPGSPIQTMHDGRGVIFDVGWSLVAGPALVMTVPAGVRYRVIAGAFYYTTSAAPGNRIVIPKAQSALGKDIWLGPPAAQQAPGTTSFYSIGSGMSPNNRVELGVIALPWPADLELAVGQSVTVSVISADAADAFSIQSLVVREWMDA